MKFFKLGFIPRLGWLGFGFICVLGFQWALLRGAPDFNVFYATWKMILNWQGHLLYVNAPDRFLYAPGFAYLFSFLALLPQKIALAIWTIAKIFCLALVVKVVARRLIPEAPSGIIALAVIVLARPVLVDIQYGQVNLFIVAAALWALMVHFDHKTDSKVRFLAWFLLGIASVSKLITLPVLLVAVLTPSQLSKKQRTFEVGGALCAIALLLILPLLFYSPADWVFQHREWVENVQSRGMPLDSHNQSIAAMASRMLTTTPFRVIAWGPPPVVLGFDVFSLTTIKVFSLLWMLLLMGGVIVLIKKGPRSQTPFQRLCWVSLLLGVLICASHLIWKPYFVFGIPAVMTLMAYLWRQQNKRLSVIMVLFFIVVNFSTVDILGAKLGGWLESFAILFWIHVVLMVLLFWVSNSKELKEQ